MALKNKLSMIVLVLLCAGWAGAWQNTLYAQDDMTNDPGYIDFTDMESRFDAEPNFQVNIKGHLLKLVAEASREDDPEFADLLLRLRAIQVRSFPMRRAQIRAMELHSESIGEELESGGWDTVVRLRDYGQYVDVYAIENPEYILGLMMMVVDAEQNETVLINIVGDIAADELGRIGSKFDIAPLSNLMEDR
ncbi:MAG: DUF4252 domain-containing protein [Rhodothermales bacterium]